MNNLPKLYNLNIEEINSDLITTIIECISEKRDFVITPSSILGVTGFPISDQTAISNNKNKVRKIKNILSELENSGYLTRRKSKQDFLGIKEVGYNLSDLTSA